MLKPEWRPDGSLVIETQGQAVDGGWFLYRFLLTAEAVGELRDVLQSPPAVLVAGQHERGPGI